MKWQLLVNRDKDFLKNCLFYESLVKEYRKCWGISHPPFLTDRIGNTFTHFISKKGYEQLDNHILNKLKKRKVIKSIETKGVKRFNQLIDFCKGSRKYQAYTNKDLLGLIKEYFYLYKKSYPHFQICIDLTYCEKSTLRLSKEEIDKLTKFRTFGRLSFEKAHIYSEPLFKEIGKRFRLNIQELKFLTPKEIYNVLSGEKFDVRKKIKDRQKCFFVELNGAFMLVENANFFFDIKEGRELKGRVAFKGKYEGVVRVVMTIGDMKKFKKGEVLVVRETVTEFVSLGMEKAGAIITNEGGLTCHASIVSREFRIPCIVGTENATKMLKNGDLVEVDAIKGKIKILKN